MQRMKLRNEKSMSTKVKSIIVIDPTGDSQLGEQVVQRGDLYRAECAMRGVKFLPSQVVRTVLAHACMPDGPYLTTRGVHMDSIKSRRVLNRMVQAALSAK